MHVNRRALFAMLATAILGRRAAAAVRGFRVVPIAITSQAHEYRVAALKFHRDAFVLSFPPMPIEFYGGPGGNVRP